MVIVAAFKEAVDVGCSVGMLAARSPSVKKKPVRR